MSYDNHDSGVFAHTALRPVPRTEDTLVTLLELAAIELTPTEGATFTRGELFAKAREIGGIGVRAVDLRVVMGKLPYLLAKATDGRWRMR